MHTTPDPYRERARAQFFEAKALVERHRADPTYMATIERLRAEIAERTALSA
jgi:hypothetical protein